MAARSRSRRARPWLGGPLALALGCSAPTATSPGELAAPTRDDDPDAPSLVVEPAPSEAEVPPIAPRARHEPRAAFFDVADAPILEVLAHGRIVRIERGGGGRSVAFRLTFADGSRGYFKPEQTFSGTRPLAEIAAFHLDRALGLGRVPATVGRRIHLDRLLPHVAPERLSELLVDDDGFVRGSISWWIPERLVPLRMGLGFERWLRFDGPLPITPFQRVRAYAALASGEVAIDDARIDGADLGRALAPDLESRPGELSDLVLFDYLIQNADRWGGDFTNVRTRGEGGPLVFLDNAGGFPPGPARLSVMDTRLGAVERFRAPTIEAITALDVDTLRERVASDPGGYALDADDLADLEVRRRALLAHVDEVRARRADTWQVP